MSKILLSVSFLLLSVSCGVISDRQLASIGKLSAGADSLSNTPRILLRNIAEIRKERSILFSASLSDPELITEQLQQTAEQYLRDTSFADKASLITDILSSYLRSLRSLSSPNRWKQTGTELRSAGKHIDKAIANYNEIEFSRYIIHEGYADKYSELAARLSESYLKIQQKKVIKEMVTVSDTLVASCCDAAILLLKSQEIDSLIHHEQIAVKREFKAMISGASYTPVRLGVQDYRNYVDLILQADRLGKNRQRCVSAFRTLKNAHQRLLKSLQKDSGIEVEDIIEEIIYINKLTNEIYNLHDGLK